MNINKKSPRRKSIKITIAVMVTMILVYVLIAWLRGYPPFVSKEPESIQPGEYFTNMQRTDAEKKTTKTLEENPDTKTKNPQNDTPTPPKIDPVTSKQQANVLLTNTGIFNGSVSASGMVTNIAEESGVCKFTFINGDTRITKESTTLVNPTSTTCKTVSFSADELPVSGTWTVQIQYSSVSSEGVSNQKEFTK